MGNLDSADSLPFGSKTSTRCIIILNMRCSYHDLYPSVSVSQFKPSHPNTRELENDIVIALLFNKSLKGRAESLFSASIRRVWD